MEGDGGGRADLGGGVQAGWSEHGLQPPPAPAGGAGAGRLPAPLLHVHAPPPWHRGAPPSIALPYAFQARGPLGQGGGSALVVAAVDWVF